MSKSKEWFEENVIENREELLQVGELANRLLHDKISLAIPDPQITIAMYCNIFETICKVVAKREDEWDEFCVNVANRLRVGYTTTDSDEEEKTGNFMVFIQHMQEQVSNDMLDEDENDTIVLCTQWNAANIKEQTDIIKEISVEAKKQLSSMINIKAESSEFIIPTFCIIHEQLINYIRLKRVEENRSEYELNVAGLFTIGIMETDDAEEEIYFVPSISLKLLFKNDGIATGRGEE